jgi:predicted kinase
VLISLSGLPGVGKTTVARELAAQIGAVHLRIDSIEQALRNEGIQVEGEGYAVAYAVAEDNLRLGRVVISDCVNPDRGTREAWRAVADRAGVRMVDVELSVQIRMNTVGAWSLGWPILRHTGYRRGKMFKVAIIARGMGNQS